MGGLPRRDTFVRSLEATTQVVLVDNGDINKEYGRQAELKYETAMRAMAEMGYVAANAGEKDLLLGLDYLNYVSDFTGVPLLSANIVNTDGTPVFKEFVVHESRGAHKTMTTAVIGIISTDFKQEIEGMNSGLLVEEYEPRLGQFVEQLGEKADLLIVLAHMNETEAQELAARFPRIDLIVASHCGDDYFPVPLMSGGVPIVFSGIKGMYVGEAKYAMGKDGAKLAKYSVQKLDGTIADSPRMAALFEDYQQMVRAEDLLAAYPRTDPGPAKFVGNEKCGRCHSLSTYRFRKDKHNHAFDVIVEKGHSYDPECVMCHTVGFGFVSGFESPDTTPKLEHVGCEDCHGPGSIHIEKPMDKEYGKADKETCKTCHTPENSPKFVYEERIEKINHNSFFACSAKICHWLD